MFIWQTRSLHASVNKKPYLCSLYSGEGELGLICKLDGGQISMTDYVTDFPQLLALIAFVSSVLK